MAIVCCAGAIAAALVLFVVIPARLQTPKAIPDIGTHAPTVYLTTAPLQAEHTPTPAVFDGPAEGGLTDNELRGDVWDTIRSFYSNVRGCSDVSSQSIEVAKPPDDSGSWQEEWRVTACGTGQLLTIAFTVTADGGIYYDIRE